MEGNTAINVFLADDHEVVREGVKTVLAANSGLKCVGEASDAVDTIQKIRTIPVDVLVLDIAMPPGKSGLEVIGQIRNEHPEMGILVFSMYPEEQYAYRALKQGASGYLGKGCSANTIIQAIMKIAYGGKYVSDKVANQIICNVGGRGDFPHDRLTTREFEVMMKIVGGKSMTEIAHELYISIKTASTHRKNLLAKMGLETNSELVTYSIAHNLSI